MFRETRRDRGETFRVFRIYDLRCAVYALWAQGVASNYESRGDRGETFRVFHLRFPVEERVPFTIFDPAPPSLRGTGFRLTRAGRGVVGWNASGVEWKRMPNLEGAGVVK